MEPPAPERRARFSPPLGVPFHRAARSPRAPSTVGSPSIRSSAAACS